MLAITFAYIEAMELVNYNKLRYFYEAGRTLNLTRAARNLYISQPALSKHIADLEGDLGVILFVRTNRNLVLTRGGEVLMEECARIFECEEEIYRRVRSAASIDGVRVKLAFMGIDAAYRIPDFLARIGEKWPHISIETQRLNWDRVYDAVERGTADLGLKLSSCESYPEHIGRRVLREDHVAAVLPAGHPLAGAGSLRLEQLKDEPFVFLTKEESVIPHDHALRMCREAGFTPNIVASYQNVETVVMMVRAGAGVALLSPFAPLGGLSGVECVPLTAAPEITLDLLWRKDNPNPAVGLLVDCAGRFDW